MLNINLGTTAGLFAATRSTISLTFTINASYGIHSWVVLVSTWAG